MVAQWVANPKSIGNAIEKAMDSVSNTSTFKNYVT